MKMKLANLKLILLVIGLLITASSAPIENPEVSLPDLDKVSTPIEYKYYPHIGTGAASIENDMANASKIRMTPRGKGN
ncbi:hypothetical protein BCR32DRAFT_325705 [Anaeromyces robustus]|uniref:Uncharacterized protein n=1 Tax=Anaeromyces robustus TaxID=1754192 RepID=A0A1Y1XGI1_9FUNG|nr:hypothetical protein BCR32DRAFT_325705 [Anaeromyces robustus]|eukprot:ORX84868.1 hypothetical protein BCR32DRAFT_325705 [Anaeromyces robustus]